MDDDRIVISGYIDNTILQVFPRLSLVLYDNVNKVIDQVEAGPVVAEKMYISEDIIKYNPNVVLAKLVELFNSPLFEVKETIFIVSNKSDMLERLEFLINRQKLGAAKIVQGEVQKEFIISVIRGDASAGKTKLKRKEVVRHRRGDYINQKRAESQFQPIDRVVTEEDRLSEIGREEQQERDETLIHSTEEVCEIVQITGINDLTTSTFAVILSQFMSGYGKTIIIETDITYLTTSWLITQGKLSALTLKLADFYRDPLAMVQTIKETDKSLICIISDSASKDKGFRPYSIIHALFNMLRTNIKYFIVPTKNEDLLPSMRTIVVMDNDLISIIKTIHTIPASSIDNMQFVCIHNNKEYIAIRDSSVISSFIYEITGVVVEVPVYDVGNLNLKGGDVYDLYRYVEGGVKQSANV